MKSIRLSKNHGINSSILVCPLCEEETGVALLGKLKNDAKAPKYIADRDPCEKCVKLSETHLIVAESDDNGDFVGGYIAIEELAASKIFSNLVRYTGIVRTTREDFAGISRIVKNLASTKGDSK